MQKLRKLIRGKKGFTLVELIVVITILMVITVAAVPAFIGGLRRAQFANTVANVVSLLDQARTQALASELDSEQKIPVGGYGVFFDLTIDPTAQTQRAILFIDDWNEAAAKEVKVNYADEDILDRVLPDGIFTDGKDTELATVEINKMSFIRLTELKGKKLSDNGDWDTAVGNQITVIFTPPYAETTIVGENSGTKYDLQNFEAEFELLTEGTTRTIKFNRVTTAPQVFKN